MKPSLATPFLRHIYDSHNSIMDVAQLGYLDRQPAVIYLRANMILEGLCAKLESRFDGGHPIQWERMCFTSDGVYYYARDGVDLDLPDLVSWSEIFPPSSIKK